MKCKLYENTNCININAMLLKKGEKNNACCGDCLIHAAIEHDMLLEEEFLLTTYDKNGNEISKEVLSTINVE